MSIKLSTARIMAMDDVTMDNTMPEQTLQNANHQETVDDLSTVILALNKFASASSDGSVPNPLMKDFERYKADANDLQFKLAGLRTRIQEFKDESSVVQARFARNVVKGYLAQVGK